MLNVTVNSNAKFICKFRYTAPTPNPGRRKKTASRAVERIQMNSDELLFEMRGPKGEVWKLYADGCAVGFPPGTIVVNHSSPLVARRVGEMIQKAVSLSAQ